MAEPVPTVSLAPEIPEVPEIPEPQPETPVPVPTPEPVVAPESPQISTPSPVPGSSVEPSSPPSSQPPPPSNPSGYSVPQMISVLKFQLDQKRVLANLARSKQKEERLAKILAFANSRGFVNNQSVRDLLHVSQSTATDYLNDLVNHGILKTEGKSNAVKYSY